MFFQSDTCLEENILKIIVWCALILGEILHIDKSLKCDTKSNLMVRL